MGVRKIPPPRSGSGFGLRLALDVGLGGGGGNFPRTSIMNKLPLELIINQGFSSTST